MFGRMGRDASSLLGVEITPPFIRLVRLCRRRGRYQLQGWALEPLPKSAMHNGWIAEPEQVGAVLREAVVRCTGQGQRGAVALPGGLLIEKILSLPGDLEDRLIDERLSRDVGEFVPFALEDAAIEFQSIGPSPGNPLHQLVVVAVCHLALLDALQASAECAGLFICAVEPDAHALRRAVQAGGIQEAMLLQLEAGALVIHEFAAEPVAPRREVLLYECQGIVQEVVTAVDNYLLSSPGRALPGQVLLAGGGAHDQSFAAQLEQRLGIEVRHVDPFQSLIPAPGLDKLPSMEQAKYLAVACGLAMREGGRCLN